MADRISTVQSSSRSRTRAPSVIRPKLQFVTPAKPDHGFVIATQHWNRPTHGHVRLITLIVRHGTRGWVCRFTAEPRAWPLPCFSPAKPEDSLFLPRSGHGERSHFARWQLANG